MRLVLTLQALALIGLAVAQPTMQPARGTMRAAAALAGDGVVVIPHGNDGVGIVGAAANEAPPDLRLLIVRADETPAAIRARAARFPRAVVALLDQDEASRAALAQMQAAFDHPCWRRQADGYNVIAFQRICSGD